MGKMYITSSDWLKVSARGLHYLQCNLDVSPAVHTKSIQLPFLSVPSNVPLEGATC